MLQEAGVVSVEVGSYCVHVGQGHPKDVQWGTNPVIVQAKVKCSPDYAGEILGIHGQHVV